MARIYDLGTTTTFNVINEESGFNEKSPKDYESGAPTHSRSHSRGSSTWWSSYPSWLPKRPSPPQPQFTMSTTATPLSDAGGTTPQSSVGRRATPRSVRIMHQPGISEASGGSLRQREVTETTQVGTTPTARGFEPASPATWEKRPMVRRPRFRAGGLRLENTKSPSLTARLRFFLLPLLTFGHLLIQTYFDFNAVFVLVEVTRFPSPSSIAPASDHTWALVTSAYIFCWLAQVVGIFILYEVLYSFYRRWRVKRPLIAPLYLSSPAHNMVCMTSYKNFCFFRYVRRLAFQHNDVDGLSGKWDGFAEQCYFWCQNLPTVVSLLPRAVICLALLFTFSLSSGGIPDGSSQRDTTFFRSADGTLTDYARGVLIANAAWAMWRTLLVIASFIGLWVVSGEGCAGLCGPRFRWLELDDREEKARSHYADAEAEILLDYDPLGWEWRERAYARIKHAWEFCLTFRKAEQQESPRNVRQPSTPLDTLPGGVLDQILAEAGYKEPPTPARRKDRLMDHELFDSPPPTPRQGLSDILPPPTPTAWKGKGKERDGPLMKLPYPFTGSGSEDRKPRPVSSSSIPFPNSPTRAEGGVLSAAEDLPRDATPPSDDQEIQLTPTVQSPSQDEDEGGQTSSNQQETRQSSSLSSLGQPLSLMSPPRQAFRHRTQRHVRQRSSSDGHIAGSSASQSQSQSQSRSSEAAAPPAHIQDVYRQERPRSRSDVASSTHSSSKASGRPRTRTVSGIPRSCSPAPQPEPESFIDSDHDEEAEAAEREDSVGLLSASVSPRSSLGRMRKRKSGRKSDGSTSTNTGSGTSRSVSGSTSASARSRAQSLIQAVVPGVARRSRAYSAESGSGPPPRSSEDTGTGSGTGSSNAVNRDYTFGRPLPWQRRPDLAPAPLARQTSTGHRRQESAGTTGSVPSPIASEYSSPSTHVRSGSEGGDYTFGTPIPLLTPVEEAAYTRPDTPPIAPPITQNTSYSTSEVAFGDYYTAEEGATTGNGNDDDDENDDETTDSVADMSTAPASMVTAPEQHDDATLSTERHSLAPSTFTITAHHPDPTLHKPL